MIKIPICFFCENYIGHVDVGEKRIYCCKAFPKGIPSANMREQTGPNECADKIGYAERQKF